MCGVCGWWSSVGSAVLCGVVVQVVSQLLRLMADVADSVSSLADESSMQELYRCLMQFVRALAPSLMLVS